MDASPPHAFRAGQRVKATRRPGFPPGTVLDLLANGFVLVRWDSNVLETAHHGDLEPLVDTT